METCILIPRQLSLILRPTGAPGRPLEMGVTLWANCCIEKGDVFHPDEGDIRLDKLEVYSELISKDVSGLLLILNIILKFRL